MRILWFSLILLFNFQAPHDGLLIHEKEITVSGNTSLGTFDCSYHAENRKDTLAFIRSNPGDTFLFEIPVADFSCGNFILNNDFRKTIKAKEYPKAQVKVSNLRKRSDGYDCELSLNLAGKDLVFRDFGLADKQGRLVGYLTLDFETLDLDPPSKFGGLIKVDDVLYLSLSLVYEKLNGAL